MQSIGKALIRALAKDSSVFNWVKNTAKPVNTKRSCSLYYKHVIYDRNHCGLYCNHDYHHNGRESAINRVLDDNTYPG